MNTLVRFKLLRIIAIILIVGLGISLQARKSPENKSPIKMRKYISKQLWAREMKEDLSALLCADRQYFKSCFRYQDKSCSQIISMAAEKCVHQMNIPDKFRPARQGMELGRALGVCTALNFEKKMTRSKLNKRECFSREAWL